MTTNSALPRGVTASTPLDDLRTLLPDWARHLRARNRTHARIGSYRAVAENLMSYLLAQGMPVTAGAVTRDHVEAFLADLTERVAPATVAKHYRSLPALEVATGRG